MLINIVLFILAIPIYILSLFAGVINSVIPVWIGTEITSILGGTGILNTIFPMYPHPGMAGLAGTMGIMTIFGWATLVMSYLVMLSLGYKLLKLFFGGIPWNTQGMNIKTGGQ